MIYQNILFTKALQTVSVFFAFFCLIDDKLAKIFDIGITQLITICH